MPAQLFPEDSIFDLQKSKIAADREDWNAPTEPISSLTINLDY